jgi:hypothetical protein
MDSAISLDEFRSEACKFTVYDGLMGFRGLSVFFLTSFCMTLIASLNGIPAAWGRVV